MSKKQNSVVPAEVVALVEKSDRFVAQAEEFKVADAPAYQQAGNWLKQIKSKTKELDDLRKSMTKPLDDSKKAIMAFFKPPMERLSTAEVSIKRGMVAYAQIEEKKRVEAEEKLRKEQEKLLEKADIAAAAGKEKRAEKFEEKAEMMVTTVQSTVQKVAGIQFRKVWRYNIINEKLIPREYLMVDEKKLGELARTEKENANVPGVEFYADDVLAAGR